MGGGTIARDRGQPLTLPTRKPEEPFFLDGPFVWANLGKFGEKRGKWIIATVAEVPGVNTQGRTMREARANLVEALGLILDCNRRLAEETFRPEELRKERVRVAVGR